MTDYHVKAEKPSLIEHQAMGKYMQVQSLSRLDHVLSFSDDLVGIPQALRLYYLKLGMYTYINFMLKNKESAKALYTIKRAIYHYTNIKKIADVDLSQPEAFDTPLYGHQWIGRE